mgnify:CR=1 FL=1
MTEQVDTKALKNLLDSAIGARLKMWINICARCGLCADTCHYYLANDRDPKMIPSYKIRLLKEIWRKKGKVDKAFLDKVYYSVYHECTMCKRCTMYCPFGIDIASMINLLRGLLCSQKMVPERLAKAIENYQSFGNQMGISKEEWLETIKWCEEEASQEIKGLKIPIDRKGAKILYTVNPREVQFYPQEIMEAAKIFHVADEDWTVSSEMGWDNTNLAMFVGDTKTARFIVGNTFQRADELGVKQVLISE